MSEYPDVGRYVVVKTGGFVPWMIRMATHSPYNHVFIVVDERGGIVEAEWGGARKAHIEEYAGCLMAVNTDRYGPGTGEQIAALAMGLVGEKYNGADIVELGLESLGLPWKWLAKLSMTDGEMMCSQMTAVVGSGAGLNWMCGKTDATQVTPGDLGRRTEMTPYIL